MAKQLPDTSTKQRAPGRTRRDTIAAEDERGRVASPDLGLQTLLAERPRPERPSRLQPKGMIALQRLAGNAAAASLLNPRSLSVQRDLDDVDSGMNITDQTTSVLGSGANIGSNTAWQMNPNGTGQQIGVSSVGVGTGAVGLTSIYELGRSGAQLHDARKKFQEVRTDKTRRNVKRVRSRNVNKGAGDVIQNSGNVVGSTTGVVTSGIGIAGNVTSSLSTAGNVAGVVGSTVALPIQMFSMVRGSWRAEKQRQRMNRIESTSKAITHGTTEVDPSEIERLSDAPRLQAKRLREGAEKNLSDTKQAINDLEKERDKAQTELTTRESRLSDLGTQISGSEKALADLQRRSQRARAMGRSTGATPERIQAEEKALSELRKEQEKARRSVERQKGRVEGFEQTIKEHQQHQTDYENEVKQHQDSEDLAQQTNGGEVSRAQAMKGHMANTGHLTDQGDQVGKLPSLKEIAEYATTKNKRGFARRTIGAVAAGVGVAAGAIGLASAVESLQGNNGIAANLGIASAVIGGVAALGGLAVAAWKIHSWRKKRSAQAAKMAQKTGVKPSFKETYNPFNKKKVDQSTKRRHYATALLSYATHGPDDERAEAWKIMASLDPKGPWAKKSTRPGKDLVGIRSTITDADRAELVNHFMDKMASGG